MNIYTIYADVKEGVDPKDFVIKMSRFLDTLDTMYTYRITRMKLGFRSMDMPEFRIDMEFRTLGALDQAMNKVLYNDDTDEKHVAFNQLVDVETIQHFLYRDYPADKA